MGIETVLHSCESKRAVTMTGLLALFAAVLRIGVAPSSPVVCPSQGAQRETQLAQLPSCPAAGPPGYRVRFGGALGVLAEAVKI